MNFTHRLNAGLVLVIDWLKETPYKGFDGREIWSNAQWQSAAGDKHNFISKIFDSENKRKFNTITIQNGLVSLEQLNEVLIYKESIIQDNRLIYLQLTDLDNQIFENDKRFTFLGYDYGYFTWESNYYSFIYHQIFDTSNKEFVKFQKDLNENILFDSLDSIPNLENTIKQLKEQGSDLEENEEFQPIAVYSYSPDV